VKGLFVMLLAVVGFGFAGAAPTAPITDAVSASVGCDPITGICPPRNPCENHQGDNNCQILGQPLPV
jgi:hypothetical protein